MANRPQLRYRYENDGKIHLDVDNSGRYGLSFSSWLEMANSLNENVELIYVVGS